MTASLQLYQLATTPDDRYPRLLTSHPRNRSVDWRAVDEYAATGVSPAGEFDLFVKTDREIDTVHIAGLDPVISGRLRAVLEPLVGGPATFLPLTVNSQLFWIMQIRHLVDALDLDRSDLVYSRHSGAIKLVNKPVWRAQRITNPSLFVLPRKPKTIWATAGVKEAYERSGCNGLMFW